ncbi:MAG TPA: carboxypeptidase M32 [Patescibacteria group bacterium]|nr:carboxypeptidase M32 [Patescibacteria group bacterium]
MHPSNSTIRDLLTHYREIALLAKVKALIDWDMNVNLPPKAAEGRARQTAHLSELITRLWLDAKFRKNLEKASELKDLSFEEKAIVRNLTIGGKYYFSVPKELIVEKDKVSGEAFMAWKEAKEKNDFSIFLPFFKELLRLDQVIAGHLRYKDHVYDALLDMFEPELTVKKAKTAFAAIKPELVQLVAHIKQAKEYTSTSNLVDGSVIYPKAQQDLLNRALMEKMGFDFQAGRIDVSPHPFTTTLDHFDIRVTTMHDERDFRTSYTATMHETGHALYEQGGSVDYVDTPLEGGVSYGIHEALSRFWENMVGRSPAFLSHMTPVFKEFYPEQLSSLTIKEAARLVNLVKPSLIRIEADEVTYSLHIILRFEIEQELFEGKIQPEDAPEVWRAKSQEYFGIVPEKDSEGVLQDVHWSYGAFGYFPSYALGNLYGAQLLHSLKKEIKFDTELEKGNLLPIKGWLDENVHRFGSLYMPDELIKKATGEKLNPQYFIDYLKDKYTHLYEL